MLKNTIRLTIIFTFVFLTACGGGGESTAPTDTGAVNTTPSGANTESTPPATTSPASSSATPNSPVSTFAGTYTGRLIRLYCASPYSGPMSITIGNDNIITGTWIVTRGNTIDPVPTKLVNLTGSVDHAGNLAGYGATDSTVVLVINGVVNKTNGTISGTYTHYGAGVCGGQSYTESFTLSK